METNKAKCNNCNSDDIVCWEPNHNECNNCGSYDIRPPASIPIKDNLALSSSPPISQTSERASKEYAESVISITHPDFYEERIRTEAKFMAGYNYASQSTTSLIEDLERLREQLYAAGKSNLGKGQSGNAIATGYGVAVLKLDEIISTHKNK